MTSQPAATRTGADDLARRIAAVAQPEPYAPSWTPTRYPFTYAYDFARSHYEALGLDDFAPAPDPTDESGHWSGSRGRAGAVVRAYAEAVGIDRHEAVVALAEAYLDEHHLQPTAEDKAARLADIPRPWWPAARD